MPGGAARPVRVSPMARTIPDPTAAPPTGSPTGLPPANAARAAHALSAAEAVTAFGTDAGRGLAAADVERLRAVHGHNELPEAPPAPWWRRLARQFADLVILVLLAAAVVSAAVGEVTD